jgi:hypothetical protein
MENNNNGRKSTYQFNVSGEQGTYNAVFSISGETFESQCSCLGAKRKKCWHTMYVLAGKTSRIIGGDIDRQSDLIAEAGKIKNGRATIAKARKKFLTETHCRRCNGDRVVKIRHSILARLFMMFREGRHAYFCKECKWSW